MNPIRGSSSLSAALRTASRSKTVMSDCRISPVSASKQRTSFTASCRHSQSSEWVQCQGRSQVLHLSKRKLIFFSGIRFLPEISSVPSGVVLLAPLTDQFLPGAVYPQGEPQTWDLTKEAKSPL